MTKKNKSIVAAILVLGLCASGMVYWLVVERNALAFRGWYRKSCTRVEPFRELSAIRSAEVSYFAEYGAFVVDQPLTPVPDRRGDHKKYKWNRNTRFSLIGYVPEDDVCCSYEIQSRERDSRDPGFIARAECDFSENRMLTRFYITDESTDIKKQ